MIILLLLGQIISSTKTDNVLITNIPPIERGAVIEDAHNDTYDHIIKYYCQLYGIDVELVKLIIEKESNFNPRAVSTRGAVGLMQLMPETARLLGIKNLYDPWENIHGGVKYLKKLSDMFAGDIELVLAAYHAGPGLVKKLNRVPTISTTIAYVNTIISRYQPDRQTKSIYFTLTEDGTPFLTNLPRSN
jgi:soluble lytic murein transglycosylase-like protein